MAGKHNGMVLSVEDLRKNTAQAHLRGIHADQEREAEVQVY